jgi:hypothetical protein
MGNDLHGSELISSEADVLRMENQQFILVDRPTYSGSQRPRRCLWSAVITRGNSTW